MKNVPFVEGAIAGVLAWVVGYGVTYAIVADDIRGTALHNIIEAFEGDPATYEMVGWVFYNAHFVNTVFRDLPLLGSHSASYVGGDDGFSVVLYAIPVAILLIGGFAIAWYRTAESPTDGLVAGLTIVPGYLVLAVAGAFLFEVSLGGATGRPDLLPAILLAGFVIPAIFSGAGGVIGSVVRSNRA